MIRPLLLWSPNLRNRLCEPVNFSDDYLQPLIADLFESNEFHRGLALAACQVGEFVQLFVINFSEQVKVEASGPPTMLSHRYVMINPVIQSYAGNVVIEESCLSLPMLRADVARPAEVVVQYLDENGNSKTLAAEGMLARVILHETSHLVGRFFVDELSSLKRGILLRKHQKNCARLEAQGKADQHAAAYAR